MSFAHAVEALARGSFVVLTDSEARTGMSELILAGRSITPEAVNFMAKQGGILGIATTRQRCAELGLTPMPTQGRHGEKLGYHTTFEARLGISTGISAFDRARTINVASNPAAGPDDVVRPGHVLPAAARPGGVFELRGLTEAAVDLARLAGPFSVVARCALLDDAGELLSGSALASFCRENKLLSVSVDEIHDARAGLGNVGPSSASNYPIAA